MSESCPCCGDTNDVSINGAAVTGAHKFTITTGGDEIDVRTFDSGAYGDTIVCNQNGTIVINSYCSISVDDGDTGVTIAANVCGISISGTVTAVSHSVDVDAKGVVDWTYNFKITDDLTGW